MVVCVLALIIVLMMTKKLDVLTIIKINPKLVIFDNLGVDANRSNLSSFMINEIKQNNFSFLSQDVNKSKRSDSD